MREKEEWRERKRGVGGRERTRKREGACFQVLVEVPDDYMAELWDR